MAKKKVTRAVPSKQQKTGNDPLDYLCALIFILTEAGVMQWFSGGGTDILSHISVISKKRGRLQLLVGGVKPWTQKVRDRAFEKRLYKLARKAAQQTIEQKAAEAEQKAAKLRAQAKGQRGRP